MVICEHSRWLRGDCCDADCGVCDSGSGHCHVRTEHGEVETGVDACEEVTILTRDQLA